MPTDRVNLAMLHHALFYAGTAVIAATLWLPAAPPQAAEAGATDSVGIAGGDYPLGRDDGPADARPAHRVSLAPFWIDRFEVTNAAFAEFLNTLDVTAQRDAPAGGVRASDISGPDAPRLFEHGAARPLIALEDEDARIGIAQGRFVPAPGWEHHPVVEASWDGARAYCAWRGARLPSEAEWEAAARGQSGRTYPWGEQAPTPERAAFARRRGQTAAVGSYPLGATPEGVHDLAGNVAEWTSSLYRPYPYDPSDGREDPSLVGERVTRGGDYVFDVTPDKLAGFFRSGFSRRFDRGHRHIGFRCAR